MSYRNAFSRIIACWTIMLVAIGCSSSQWADPRKGKSLAEITPESAEPPSDSLESTPTTKFRWDGGGVVLGEADQPAYTLAEFKTALTELYDQKRQRSFRNLVRRYPDLALELIQGAAPAAIGDAMMRHLAMELDAYLSPGNYFSEMFHDSDGSLGPYLEKRSKCWQAIQSGDPSTAIKLNLTKHKPRPASSFLRLDGARIMAIAYMMNGQLEDAIRAIEQAGHEVKSAPPLVASKYLLLQGEIYRHAGRQEDWRRSWQQAIDSHARLVAEKGVCDAPFWHRAAFARPAALPWSVESSQHFGKKLSQSGIEFAGDLENNHELREALMWAVVGMLHLDRDEGQSAILCFKKAEALTQDRQLAGQLQLFQARGLILAGQPGPASALLIRLIAQHDAKNIAGRAQAILGAIKVQNGAVAQGQKLLEAALESSDSWPGLERELARADLALVKLITGRAEAGLAELDSAFQTFMAMERWDHAYQCLWNVARYHELLQHEDDHHQAQLRLAQLESLDPSH